MTLKILSTHAFDTGIAIIIILQKFQQNWSKFAVEAISSEGLPSELRIFNRPLSPTFFSHLKTALFNRAGVGSASE